MKRLNKNEIITALKNGNYSIKYDYDCNCQMNLEISKQGILKNNYNTDNCWDGHILYINDMPIAQWIRYEKPEIITDCITVDDIPDEIWDKICDEMRISDIKLRGEGVNPEHDKKVRESLTDFLTDLVEQGWKLYKDNLRGFANEYILYLISPKSSLQDPDSGEKINIERLKKIGIKEFADNYLWEGDPLTESYVSTRVVL